MNKYLIGIILARVGVFSTLQANHLSTLLGLTCKRYAKSLDFNPEDNTLYRKSVMYFP